LNLNVLEISIFVRWYSNVKTSIVGGDELEVSRSKLSTHSALNFELGDRI